MLKDEMLTVGRMLKRAAGEDPNVIEGITKPEITPPDLTLSTIRRQYAEEIQNLKEEIQREEPALAKKKRDLQELEEYLTKIPLF